ncbi:protein tyrosine phosphatase [Mycolicibacterium canariasense]|uniref:Protein tyrosine phosphatase n=1 Tax=Mycolicibacterium canariasense TaxID=228230 RepID=A0A100W8M6_MYCCR|nr:low molecular weight phosphatase family protein [Mycolicibacterium canariasense]GAS93702.1 protein tyrosine phosphatase [Mycolicibacterium canariasense]
MCTGNICRSPTAERLAAELAATREIPQFVASSAGTHAMIGYPVHVEAARVIRDLGGDPADFAARQLTPAIANGVDLVLTMTTAHRNSVLELAPRQFRRTFTLGEAALLATEHEQATVTDLAGLRPHLAGRRVAEIADPIGHDREYFEEVGVQIARLLPAVLDLCRRTAAPAGD